MVSVASIFAARLCEIMASELGVSSSDARKGLAKELGVSLSAVRKWENGMALPEPEKIVSIACLFGVSIDWLLGNSNFREPRQKPCSNAHGVVTMPLIEEVAGSCSYSKMVSVPIELMAKNGASLLDKSAYLLFRSPSDSMWPTIRKHELVLVKYGVSYFDENEILLLSFDNHLAIRRLQRRLGACAVMADNRNHYPEVVIENECVSFFGLPGEGGFFNPMCSQDAESLNTGCDLKEIFSSEGRAVMIVGRVVGCIRRFG